MIGNTERVQNCIITFKTNVSYSNTKSTKIKTLKTNENASRDLSQKNYKYLENKYIHKAVGINCLHDFKIPFAVISTLPRSLSYMSVLLFSLVSFRDSV